MLRQSIVSLVAIHRVIPKPIAHRCSYALTCRLQTKGYHDFQMLAFGSAGCEDRQGRIDLGVARYRRRTMWKIRSWFRAAGSSARNVTGGRKLARHDFVGESCQREFAAALPTGRVRLHSRLTFVPFRGDTCRMTKLIGRRQFTIEWGHCDPAGIVFNARFFEFFDWGTWSLFDTALGVKPHELLRSTALSAFRWWIPARASSRRRASATWWN